MSRVEMEEARMWNTLCHLSGLLSFLGPLLVWRAKRNEFPSVDEHGKECLNFQLSMVVYLLAAWILFLIQVGKILMPLLIVADAYLIVHAAVKVNRGEAFRYPCTIPFMKGGPPKVQIPTDQSQKASCPPVTARQS